MNWSASRPIEVPPNQRALATSCASGARGGSARGTRRCTGASRRRSSCLPVRGSIGVFVVAEAVADAHLHVRVVDPEAAVALRWISRRAWAIQFARKAGLPMSPANCGQVPFAQPHGMNMRLPLASFRTHSGCSASVAGVVASRSRRDPCRPGSAERQGELVVEERGMGDDAPHVLAHPAGLRACRCR